MQRNGTKPALDQLETRVAPAVYHVDTLQDTQAVDLHTGTDAAGHVSLRSAVTAANASPEDDVILLGAGIFRLTQSGAGEDKARAGDLDIHGDLTIQGEGASKTTLDVGQVERMFEVFQGELHLNGLTLTGGDGLLKVHDGNIRFDDVQAGGMPQLEKLIAAVADAVTAARQPHKSDSSAIISTPTNTQLPVAPETPRQVQRPAPEPGRLAQEYEITEWAVSSESPSFEEELIPAPTDLANKDGQREAAPMVSLEADGAQVTSETRCKFAAIVPNLEGLLAEQQEQSGRSERWEAHFIEHRNQAILIVAVYGVSRQAQRGPPRRRRQKVI